MATPLLSVSDLNVRFGSYRAVRGFSMSIHEGDFTVLMGANGSGKTTVLRAIMDFEKRESGEIRLFGAIINGRNKKVLRTRIGYVPQTLRIDFKMPFLVREVVAIGRFGIIGIGRRLKNKDYEAVDHALNEVGIHHLAERPFGHLSGGERQKVQIARAICQGSHLLFLDEPTNNLDLGAQLDFLKLLSRLHAGGMGILIVMHDIQALPSGITKAIIVSHGKKEYEGPVRDALKPENLSLIYDNRTADVIESIKQRGALGL